jgi:integrase
MKAKEIQTDPTVLDWLATVNPKPATAKNYLQAMQKFTEWTLKSPDELLVEAEEEIKRGLLPRQRSIKRYLTGFRKYLQDERYAPLSVKSYMTGVKSFYQSFDIEIPKLPRAGNRAQTLQENNEIPTREDLQEVLKFCDPLERAIILVGASSGLSAQEIINLKIRDFKKGFDAASKITTLRLRREKVQFEFITFLTPEASQAVQDYLDYRDRTVKVDGIKKLEHIKKQKVLDGSGYLFIMRKVSSGFLKNQDEGLRQINEISLLKIYRRISEKAMKNTQKGHWNLIRSHNVRKYFNSTLLNAGADSYHVDFWMGHKQDETRSAYFRASAEKMRDIYKKFVPFLTISKEMNVSESEDFKRVVEENEELKGKIETVSVERYELIQLKEEITRLKQMEEARKAIHDEFEPFIQESQRARQAVEAFFEMSFDEAIQRFDVSDALPPESEAYSRHRTRLGEDPEYYERYKEAVGHSRRIRADKAHKKAQDAIQERIKNLTL